ncbi:MAG TPA: 16S rRNA (uracil(1498)-N(3))-methyltransferase [Vicinamibacterales bacterium]|nr:16S rRNA (uracil(1498)-N(3))-methyltransferase [Vicinamibacterales bacterium]
MMPRLYVPSLDACSRTVTLPQDEAVHLRRVLRVKAGQAVRLFDGRGGEVDARVTSADRAGVVVEVGEPVAAALEWPVRVTLAQAVLKGDKIDDVIRDAVMMGVAAIQPLLTARTEVPEAAFSRGRRVERWQRIAVASAKQCGRAVVPHVLAPCSLQACLAAGLQGAALMLVEPAAAIPGEGSWPQADIPSSATLLVGPEGGWAEDEVALALEAGCFTLTLGPRTLRADAAAIVALSVMQYVWR